MTQLEVFAFLQLMDVLTTLVGIRLGMSEASPFIRMLMTAGPEPGLLASKLLAFGLGAVAITAGRPRVIGWINYWYAALVLWNCAAILCALYRL